MNRHIRMLGLFENTIASLSIYGTNQSENTTGLDLSKAHLASDRPFSQSSTVDEGILTIPSEPIKACRLFGSPPWEEETRDGQEEAGLGSN